MHLFLYLSSEGVKSSYCTELNSVTPPPNLHDGAASKGFPRGLDGKESACNAGDLGSIPGLGRSPGEGNGYPFQYSYLENLMDRGAWQATVHGVKKNGTQLSDSLKKSEPDHLQQFLEEVSSSKVILF